LTFSGAILGRQAHAVARSKSDEAWLDIDWKAMIALALLFLGKGIGLLSLIHDVARLMKALFEYPMRRSNELPQ
jgi:hypothetical protein